jgi:hypothetical protein
MCAFQGVGPTIRERSRSGTPRGGVAHCAGLAWLLDIAGDEGGAVGAVGAGAGAGAVVR